MMQEHKWLVAFACTSSTVIAAAVAVFALHSTRAFAQTSADCEILWEDSNKYGKLAYRTSTYLAKGYVASGLAAQGNYLYTMVCRR
jgi:hypothetical protein